MPFKFACPKCGSLSFNLEREHSYALNRPSELIFSCRCGKQLFGENITAEYDRQRLAWESDPKAQEQEREREERRREAEAREEQLKRAVEYRRAWISQRRASADANRRRVQDENARVWAEAAPAAASPTPWAKRPQPVEPPPPRAPVAERRPEPAPRTTLVVAPVSAPPVAAAPLVQHELPSAPPASVGAEGEVEICMWEGCTNPRAPNSKYCSRACSNRNARLRHAQRKKGPRVAA